jgi:hypothetical protein
MAWIAFSTRSRRSSLTTEVPLTTADTVKIETFAAFATANIVGLDCLRDALGCGFGFDCALFIPQR